MAFKMLPEKLKKRFSPFLLQVKNLRRWKILLGAATILPVRAVMFGINLYMT